MTRGRGKSHRSVELIEAAGQVLLEIQPAAFEWSAWERALEAAEIASLSTRSNSLPSLTITLIRDLARARRQRDLAIELLVHATAMLGNRERAVDDVREKYYRLLDERRTAKRTAA